MHKRSFGYTLALAALIAGGLGSAAMADRMRDHHPRTERGGHAGAMMTGEFFDQLDTDSDGKVTTAEIDAWRKSRVEGLDANNDGKIDLEELTALELRGAEALARRRAETMIGRMDVDGDGALSAAELMAGRGHGTEMFSRFDKDGDGAVTKAEIASVMSRLDRPGRDGHGDRHGKGAPGWGQGKRPAAEGNAPPPPPAGDEAPDAN